MPNLESIDINVESTKTYEKSIKNKELQKLFANYSESIHQLLVSLATPTFLLAYGANYIPNNKKTSAIFTIVLEKVTESLGFKPELSKADIADIVSKIALKSNKESDFEVALKKSITELKHITESDPRLEESFRVHKLNILLYGWTIFESISRDLWVLILNRNPKYASRVLEKAVKDDIKGISSKNISIGLLSKYNFDVSNNLGDLLAPKYDFTSCRGILLAYKDLLSIDKSKLKELESITFVNFEAMRNLIVQNAGVIDDIYLKKCNQSHYKEGDKLVLTSENIQNTINTSIAMMITLFSFAEEKN